MSLGKIILISQLTFSDEEIFNIFIQISLKFGNLGAVDIKSAVVQIMARTK